MTAAPQPGPPATGEPLAIVAGAGGLPAHVVERARARGHPVFVACLSGSALPDQFPGVPAEIFGLGQFGGLLKALKSRGIRRLAFIGSVVRPGMRDIKPDLGLIRHAAAVRQAFGQGDDGLLRGIIGIMEAEGLAVHGALEIAPELAAEPGPLTRLRPPAVSRREIEQGRAVIDALSLFDVGQCVVVSDGRPVAIEGAEGTDAMLVRVREMREGGRLRRETGGGVLVKMPKRNQDMRIDIPTIGPRTVENARAAGLAGIAIAAGSVLVADRADTVRLADEHRLFIEALP